MKATERKNGKSMFQTKKKKKTMKKTIWSLAALMLMAAPVMTSCSNDLDEVAPAEEVKENVVTLTIKMPEQAETRVGIDGTLKLTGWEQGDIVKVYDVKYFDALNISDPIPFECTDPESGTFSGTLPDGKSLSDYNFAVYGPDLVNCQGFAGFLTKKVSSNLADVTCLSGEISSGSCSMAICNNVLKVTNEGPAVDVAWKYDVDTRPLFYSLYCVFDDVNHFARLFSCSYSDSFIDVKFNIPSGDSYVLLPPMGAKYNLVNESGDCVVEGHNFSSAAIGKLFTKTISGSGSGS